MARFIVRGALWLGIFTSSWAYAGERTVTIAVEGMFAEASAPILRGTLMSVPGVIEAAVSYENRAAVVTYDDTKTTINALTEAIRDAGFQAPGRP